MTDSQTKPDLLDEQALAEIETAEPFVGTDIIPLSGAERDALCATVRALRESETFWQAEALLNHFCSEHAKNTRQSGHYCTVCAKPFVMTASQGERPPKYKDLITENAALREQLAHWKRKYERIDINDQHDDSLADLR